MTRMTRLGPWIMPAYPVGLAVDVHDAPVPGHRVGGGQVHVRVAGVFIHGEAFLRAGPVPPYLGSRASSSASTRFSSRMVMEPPSPTLAPWGIRLSTSSRASWAPGNPMHDEAALDHGIRGFLNQLFHCSSSFGGPVDKILEKTTEGNPWTRLTSAQRKMLASTAMLTLVCLAWLTRFRPWAGGAWARLWLPGWRTGCWPSIRRCWEKCRGGFFIGAGFFALAHACYGAASVMVLRAMGLPFRWLNFSLLVAALCPGGGVPCLAVCAFQQAGHGVHRSPLAPT